MKILKSLLFVFLLMIGCSDDEHGEPQSPQWQKLGLDGHTVNEMQLSGTTLYVATTNGLYERHLNSGDAGFTLMGFEGKNVDAIEVVGPDQMLVSLFDRTGSEQPSRYRLDDDGATWLPLEDNFGGGSPEGVLDMERHPGDENVLYATGFSVVAKSQDQGETWTPVYGNWGGLATGISVVEINPNDVNEIWAGGQGAIENGFLLRTRDETDWDAWYDLVENPTVVKEITFTSGNRDRVFVGFEGALLKTTDGGDTWKTLIDSEENRFFFGIAVRDEDVDRVYAGGWLKGSETQSLILYVSNDGGASWQEHRFPSVANGGILDLLLETQGGQDILYLGLDKGGVYEVIFRHE